MAHALTESSVDSTDEFVDHSPKILILLHVLSTGYRHLHEHNLADPLRMFRQENFKRMQLLWNTLDVIQTVDAHDDLDSLEFPFERRNALLDFWFLKTFDEFVWVDANGVGANCDDVALELDAVGRCRKTPGIVSRCSMCAHEFTYSMRDQLLRKWRA